MITGHESLASAAVLWVIIKPTFVVTAGLWLDKSRPGLQQHLAWDGFNWTEVLWCGISTIIYNNKLAANIKWYQVGNLTWTVTLWRGPGFTSNIGTCLSSTSTLTLHHHCHLTQTHTTETQPTWWPYRPICFQTFNIINTFHNNSADVFDLYHIDTF